MGAGLTGKKILLGVSGSIAAYKAIILTRLLVKEGAEVKVVMTPTSTSFVNPINFSTLSGNECLVEYTRTESNDWNNHVALGLWADVMLIAPASATTLSKMANGLCDNLLVGIYLSARCPVFIAPAMDEDMWKHGSTQSNLRKLKSFGNIVLPVGVGSLASGLNGPGRMAEPEAIVAYLQQHFDTSSAIFSGKTILISAGPTYEHIDPVRFIGNHSSGKMGLALAERAAQLGAKVYLVLGPTALSAVHPNIETIRTTSAQEMLEAMSKYFSKADVSIFAAAVADYTPTYPSKEKIKKNQEELTLTLKKNPDIAAAFGQIKQPGQLSVGFALETENELQHAKEKLHKKNFDLIVLNSLKDEGAGFQKETNKITIIDTNNNIYPFELKSKDDVAKDILQVVALKLNK